MKKFIYSLALALVCTFAQAQVKVGANPGTIGSSSNLEVEASNGNKTSINKSTGKVTIVDGTQGAGRVFTSDANGNGSWVAGASLNVVSGTIPSSWAQLSMSTILPTFVYTGANLTLTPGKWLIFFNATYQNMFDTSMNIWWDLSTSNTTNTQTGRTLSGASPSGNYMPVSATYSVSPTTTTTYYMWAATKGGATDPTTGTAYYTGEGRLYAVPVAQ